MISNTRIPGNTRRPGFAGARRLTDSEAAELRRCNELRERDLHRLAGIEELRQRLHAKFAPDNAEVSNG
jgi:hypothetical protein